MNSKSSTAVKADAGAKGAALPATPTTSAAAAVEAPLLPLERHGPQADRDTGHPPSFYCPISRKRMRDPVVVADGHTYERRHIEEWLQKHHVSPVSGEKLAQSSVLPNHALRNAMEEYFEQVRSGHQKAIRQLASNLRASNGGSGGGGGDSGASGGVGGGDGGDLAALAREAGALMQCILLTSPGLDSEGLLRAALEEATGLLGAEGAAAFLVDRQSQELYSTASSRGDAVRMLISEGIAGQVASTGTPAILNGKASQGEVGLDKIEAVAGVRPRSLLCVPIRASKWGVMGVASVVNKTSAVASTGAKLGTGAGVEAKGSASPGKTDEAFSVHDQHILEQLVDQAAAALCSAGLLDRDLMSLSPGSSDPSDATRRRRPQDPRLTPRSSPAMSFAAQPSTLKPLLAEAIDRWEMDALALDELTDHRPLSALASYMLENLGLAAQFSMDVPRMKRYFVEIEKGYPDNPYHNRTHASSVLHVMHMLLASGGIAKACVAAADGIKNPSRRVGLVQVAGLMAAAVHDFEHEGLSNDFLVKTFSPKALRYNDRNVNENHHVAAAFEVLRKPDCNFLEAMPEDEFRKLRSLVVDMVLSTDMADGNFYLNSFKEVLPSALAPPTSASATASSSSSSACAPAEPAAKVRGGDGAGAAAAAAREFQPTSAKDAVLGLQMALKCADIGHLSFSWSAHMQWVQRLECEFFQQGDQEKKLGMEKVSFLMDRAKPGVSQTQVGFFDFVVMPLFGALVEGFPRCEPIYAAVASNGDCWRRIEGEVKAEAKS